MSLINPTLVLNCGSSSLKYALISADGESRVEGLADGLGLEAAVIKHKDEQGNKQVINIPNADHKQAINQVLELVKAYNSLT